MFDCIARAMKNVVGSFVNFTRLNLSFVCARVRLIDFDYPQVQRWCVGKVFGRKLAPAVGNRVLLRRFPFVRHQSSSLKDANISIHFEAETDDENVRYLICFGFFPTPTATRSFFPKTFSSLLGPHRHTLTDKRAAGKSFFMNRF